MTDNKFDSYEHEPLSYFVVEGMMTHITLALKRWFIIAMVELVILLATIIGFLWYISLPIEETTTVEVENTDGNANYIGNDMNGDFNYGKSKEN